MRPALAELPANRRRSLAGSQDSARDLLSGLAKRPLKLKDAALRAVEADNVSLAGPSPTRPNAELEVETQTNRWSSAIQTEGPPRALGPADGFIPTVS